MQSVDPAELVTLQGRALTSPGIAGYTIESWLECVQRHGPIFQTSLYGDECVVLAGADANKQAWRTPDDWSYRDTDAGTFFRRQMGEDHVSCLDGEPHRRLRKLILPAFGAAAMQREIAVAAQVFADALESLNGGPIDLYAELCRMFARAMTRTQVKSYADEGLLETLCRFEEEFIFGQQLSLADQALWFGRASYRALHERAFDYFEKTALERRGQPGRGDSLDGLLERQTAVDLAPLTDSELAEAVYLLSVAGVGNIANLLCPLLHTLQDGPWLAKLQEEVARFSATELSGMNRYPIMRALILEAERCFAPAPVVPKRATRDVEMLGVRIPAGSLVMHLHTLWHFDEREFEDARSFRPQRWFDGARAKPNAFGGGKHMCLGMGVTRAYMPLLLAVLCSRYTVKMAEAPHYVPIDPQFSPSPLTTFAPAELEPRA